MEWSDQGIVIAIDKYNEQSAIVSCLTQKRGLCRGFVKNTKSKTVLKSLFIGNIVHLSWSARLEQHLGNWKILSHETILPYFYHDQKKLTAVASICALTNTILLEKEGNEQIFLELGKFLYSMKSDSNWPKNLVLLELLLLQHIGYGLDLSCCAASGVTDNLTYISPKSGRALSLDSGKPYHDKLFLLPRFFIAPELDPLDLDELIYALNVTKYFFEKFIALQNNISIPKIRIILQDVLKA